MSGNTTHGDAAVSNIIRTLEREVYREYRQRGSKLRNTVRNINSAPSLTTLFFPSTPCVLEKISASDWEDNLDDLAYDEQARRYVAKAGAYALGRKTDEMIVSQLAAAAAASAPPTTAVPKEGLTRDKIYQAFDMINDPDDGQRFALVGWKQWFQLLHIHEFADMDYVESAEIPGTKVKRWLRTLWIPHSGLPKHDSVRTCFLYHKSAIGHAVGSNVRTTINWHGDEAAHYFTHTMTQGACLIDAQAIVPMYCLES